MSVIVKVAPGFSEVPLPGGLYDQGQQVKLSDAQYAGLPTFVIDQLIMVESVPDPIAYPPVDSYTQDLIEGVLGDLAVPIYLRWDGTDYQPISQKADIDRVKVFVDGPDPTTVPGVVLVTSDQWIDTN